MSLIIPSNFLFNFLTYSAVFFASLFHPYDFDLGWHLKYGEYFFKNDHILRENIFSSDMQNYHWVNSSWLTDLFSYATFANFGFLGLSILGAAVITATFYFFAKSARLDYFEKALIFPPLLYFLAPLNSISFRGQLLSLLFLGILSYILFEQSPALRGVVENYSSNDQKTSRFARILSLTRRVNTLYLLPPLFLLWSNLHGQFILGLAIFAIWIGSAIVPDLISNGLSNLSHVLENAILPIITFIASALAVLINPFGFGVYSEALKHFRNPLEAFIAEWVPFKMLTTPWYAQVLIGTGMFFGLIFLIFEGKFKEKISQITIASLLYLISFYVRRFVWPMYYLAIPLIAPLAKFFKPQSKKYTKYAATIIFVTYISLTFLIDNPTKRIQNMSWQTYCQKFVSCSDGAIQYLTSNQLTSNLLTYYGWGGYMIWRYPEIKPSIDGRMHLWQDNNGYSAFEEYFAYEQNINDIEKSPYDVVLMSPQKPLYKHLDKLSTENKWQKVYEDKFAGVFVRK